MRPLWYDEHHKDVESFGISKKKSPENFSRLSKLPIFRLTSINDHHILFKRIE